MKANSVIIIGAGLGGLAAGIRLAADGFRVKIVEKSTHAGGWLKPVVKNGFTFQNAGSIISAPFLLDDLFKYAAREREDYFELKSLSPIFQAIFPDSLSMLYYREPAITTMKNRSFTQKDREAFHKYGVYGKKIFDEVFFNYCGKPLNRRSFTPLFNRSALSSLRPERSASDAAAALFETPELKSVFSFWPLLRGGNPSRCSHLYRIIPAMLQNWDAFTVVGGTQMLIDGLVRLFHECGGEIQYNSEVQAIQIYNRTVTGIRLTDDSIQQTDIVISDADAATTCFKLIDSDRNRYEDVENARKKDCGLSAYIYHLGLRQVLQEKQPLTAFNVIFPRDIKAWQRSTFRERTLSAESFFFLNFPSKVDPLCAPVGQEAISVIIPVPNLESHINWKQESYAFRSGILDQLQTFFETDIRSNLVCESFIDPLSIEHTNGSLLGGAWSFDPAHEHSEAAYLPNQFNSIRNLYLVGNGSHPGPLIPGVLSGAKIVHEAVSKG